MRICFITDGGRHLGMGHIQQSTTFAQELAPHAQISFLTKSDEAVLARIRERGFPATRLGSDEAILEHLRQLDPDAIVFDKLDVAEELARRIRASLRGRLVIFTNLTAANRHAHAAVTADIGSRFENVRFVDEDTGTLYLYGPRYWVLRPEFYQYARRGKPLPATTSRLLLMFGGSDPANLTVAVLEELLRLDRPWRIEVVLGLHYHHDAQLEQVIRRHEGGRAVVAQHRDIGNVAELMFACDLVVASPGLSAFEALRVGVPVIVVPHDALQRDTYRGFMRMLEAGELGQLEGMIERGDFTLPGDEKIRRMEIGEGVSELVELITALPGKASA